MRKILLIALGFYLACGVAFGLVTDQGDYMCRPTSDPTKYYGAVNGVIQAPLLGCRPTTTTGDQVRWAAISTPAWLPLVVRHLGWHDSGNWSRIPGSAKEAA